MSNVHTPQRLEGESFNVYRARRAQSKAIAKTMRHGPTQPPMMPGEISEVRFWLGQHKAGAVKRLRRHLVKLAGIRQHKRNERAAKDLPEGMIDAMGV